MLIFRITLERNRVRPGFAGEALVNRNISDLVIRMEPDGRQLNTAGPDWAGDDA